MWILPRSLLMMFCRLDMLGRLVWFGSRGTPESVSRSLLGLVWIKRGTDADVDVEVALLMCAWVGLAFSVASFCLWSSSSAVSWCSSGSTGVGLMVGRAVSVWVKKDTNIDVKVRVEVLIRGAIGAGGLLLEPSDN